MSHGELNKRIEKNPATSDVDSVEDDMEGGMAIPLILPLFLSESKPQKI